MEAEPNSDVVEGQLVRRWQTAVLEDLGLSPEKAFELAGRVDHHELADFLRAHPACPPETAARILEP